MEHIQVQKIMQLATSGELVKAQQEAEKLLLTQGDHPALLDLCSVLSLQLSLSDTAIAYSKKAIAIDGNNHIYFYHAGLAYLSSKQFEAAITHFQRAIVLQAQFAPAHIQLANTFAQLNIYDQAEQHYKLAIANGLMTAPLFNNLGNVLVEQLKFSEAIEYYRKSITTNPNYVPASFNLASTLGKKNDDENSLHYFYETLRLDPNHMEASYQVGFMLNKLGKITEAIHFLTTALQKNKNLKLFVLLGNIYLRQMELAQAAITFRQGISFFPEDVELLGGLILTMQRSCDWSDINDWESRLRIRILEILQQDQAFSLLSFTWLNLPLLPDEQAALTKKLARCHFSSLAKVRNQLNFKFDTTTKLKLKIGYLTGDLRDHATSHLIRHMFKFHDKNKFEIFLFSIGPTDQTHYKDYIAAQCDHFINLYETPIVDCANVIYAHGIDILVDMMGYTEFSKPGILALKSAAIQIAYLGYPSSMGMDTIDYTFADKIVLPIEWTTQLHEKIIYLPDTVFVTDNEPEIDSKMLTRAACSLPETAFIFCSFNSSYKIDLQVFKIWMELLDEIPQSVLWLCDHNELAMLNLKKTAQELRINPDRLIFSPKINKKEHLTRMQLADLCLDCFTINAGTTAIDSLWAGIPMIGFENSLKLHVTSSILSALGLPELIAKSPDEYKNLALYFAKNPSALTNLRAKIKSNKHTHALFNTQQLVQNLEKGFQAAWANYLAGKKEHIFIE